MDWVLNGWARALENNRKGERSLGGLEFVRAVGIKLRKKKRGREEVGGSFWADGGITRVGYELFLKQNVEQIYFKI